MCLKKAIIYCLVISLILSFNVSATVIISDPKSSKSEAVNHISKAKPYGFKKSPYQVYYREVRPPRLSPYLEYLVEFKKKAEPIDPYYNYQQTRWVHDGPPNQITYFVKIYNSTPQYPIWNYKSDIVSSSELSKGWRPLKSKILWGDINGDFIRDILVMGMPTKGVSSKLLANFTLKLYEKYEWSKRGPALTERRADIIQVFTSNALNSNLYDLATVRLKDLDSDGRDELIGRQYANRGGKTLYAVSDTKGIYKPVNGPIGDERIASYRNDCGITLDGADHGFDYYTNETCNTVFVLPPSQGVTHAKKFYANSNLQMCRNVGETRQDQQEANKKIAELNLELSSIIREQIDTTEYRRLLRIMDIADDEANQLAIQVIRAEENLQHANEILWGVEEDYLDDFATDADLERAEARVRAERESLETVTYEHSLAVTLLEETEQDLTGYVEYQARRQTEVTEALDELYALNISRRNLLAELNKLHGGDLLFELRTEWSEKIREMVYRNRYANIERWQPMRLTSGRAISALPADTSEYTGILWTRMRDIKNYNLNDRDERYGVGVMAGPDNITGRSILDQEFSTSGFDRYEAEMGLSLAALCEHYPSGSASSVLPRGMSQLPQDLGVNLRSNYQIKSETGIRVAHNMGEVAKVIYRHLLSNDNPRIQYRYAFYRHHYLFRFPSWRFSGRHHVDKSEIYRIINGMNEQSWFNIRFVDPSISLANQEKIRTSVKKQLIDYIFSSISIEYSDKKKLKHNIASTVLVDYRDLKQFISQNSIWINADSYRGTFLSESQYTDYQ